MDAQYYRFNSLKLGLAEYWAWKGPSIDLLVFAIKKLLRVRVPDVYWPDPSLVITSPRPFETAPHAARLIRGMVEDCLAAGLQLQFYYQPGQLNRSENCAAMFLTRDFRLEAVCAASWTRIDRTDVTSTQFTCISRLPNDREIGTTDAPPFLPGAPWVEVERLPGANVMQVLARHEERIRDREVIAFEATEKALIDDFVAAGRRAIAFLRELRFLEPMSEDEVAQARGRLQQ